MVIIEPPPKTAPAAGPASPASARPTRGQRSASGPRLAYLDTLKVGLTALVIAHHAGQAYGPTGGRWPIFDAERAAILGPFFSVNAAFFMGLFFFVSALFVPASVDRKGAGVFLRDRLVRLGAPLAFFALAVFGPISYADYAAGGGSLGLGSYLAWEYLGRWRVDVGHLWFLEHLLVYCLIYATWRGLTGRGATKPIARAAAAPSGLAILGFAAALTAATFAVRVAFPIDRWVSLLGIVPAEVAHLPQYAVLFVAGILASRRGWLQTLPTRTGLAWLTVGVGASALRYAYSFAWPAGPGWLPAIAGGGFSSESLLWSAWELLICVGLGLGLVVLLRERAATPGRLARWAAPNAFGAYVVHVLPVVGLQLALASATLPPLGKFALVAAAAVPLSFGLAAGLRRLPGVRSVL